MHRGEEVLPNHAFVQHHGVLIVVSLPRHVGHFHVPSQRQFAILRGVAFCQNVTLLHPLARMTNGPQIDRRTLVRLAPLGDVVSLNCILETDEFFFLSPVVFDLYTGRIYEHNLALSFGNHLRSRVACHLPLNARSHDRRIGADQRHSLAHHVRSHQRSVRVVMFQEGDQSSSDRCDLCRRDVHQTHLIRLHYREVCFIARLNAVEQKVTVVIQRRIPLCYDLVLLFLCGIISNGVFREVHLSVLNLSIRCSDESEVIDLGIHTQRRDQSDVRTFWCLDGAQTAIVRIVHVAHLKSGTFTRQSTRSQSRQTALVRNLSQRIRLIHKLRQSVRSEERIDDRRDRLSINQINRSKDLIIAYVHSLAHCTRHTRQPDTKLIVQLLTHRTHTTITQVVNIINNRLGVDQLDEVFDDFDDVLLRQHLCVYRCRQIQFAIDPEAPHIAQIIAFLGKEQIRDDLSGTCLIRRISITQLTIDVQHSFLLRITRILL